MGWQGSSSVPMGCMGPDFPKGVVVTRPVAQMDLAGTALAFAGVTPDKGMTTMSFMPLAELYDDRRLLDGQNPFYLALFNLTADPFEQNDVAGHHNKDMIDSLAKLMPTVG